MNIFKTEIDDGLEEKIKTTSSICYASLVEPIGSKNSENKIEINYSSKADIKDSDLYYVQSILVTSSWNKNDDIFDHIEVWNARSTPNHKPTNLEHDEKIIIGHITSNWPMTDEGVLIDENTPINNLPKKFHILTGSVIYTGFTDPVLKARSSQLISEIEDGTKYVSMECFFRGFDYGLVDKSTGNYTILSRNDDTSYLTKYLRAYGGLGEHENYKIGRVLRQITFSGKGFVNKPANPESIIFSKENTNFNPFVSSNDMKEIIESEKKSKISEESVLSNQANLQEIDMNHENQINELKLELENAKNQLTETLTQLQAKDAKTTEYLNKLGVTEEDKKKMKAEFDELFAQQVENSNKLEAELKAVNSSLLTEKEQLVAKIQELESQLSSANETISSYKEKEAEMMKKEKMMKRQACLVDAGIDQDAIATTLEKFDSLDDTTFEAMVSLIKSNKSNGSEETVSKTEKVEKQTASEILETAEPVEEAPVNIESETVASDLENTRAALVDFVYHRLGKKLKKGE